MIKTLVNELIELNSRIPRRIEKMSDGSHETMTGIQVDPKFISTKHRCVIWTPLTTKLRRAYPYVFFFERREYSGPQKLSEEQAHLLLGNDHYIGGGLENQFSLTSCKIENDSRDANAYEFGPSYSAGNSIYFPVSYLLIPEDIHKAVGIDPKSDEFRRLIEELRSRERD